MVRGGLGETLPHVALSACFPGQIAFKCRPSEPFNEVLAYAIRKKERSFLPGLGQFLTGGLKGMKIFTTSLYQRLQDPPYAPERYVATNSQGT
jgi:hypothetical protein